MNKIFTPANVRLVLMPDLDSKDCLSLEVFPLDSNGKEIGFSWKKFKKQHEFKIKKNLLKIVDMKNEDLKNLIIDEKNNLNKDDSRDFNYFLWEGLAVKVKKDLFNLNYLTGSNSDRFCFAFNDGKLTFLSNNDKDYERIILSSSFINFNEQLKEKEKELKDLNTSGYIYSDGKMLYHCVGEKEWFENKDVIEINLESFALKLDHKGDVYLNIEHLNSSNIKKVAIPLGDINILLGDISSVKEIPKKLSEKNKMPANAVCIGKTVAELLRFVDKKDNENFDLLSEHAFLDRENYVKQLKVETTWSLIEDDNFLENHYKDILKNFISKKEVGEFNCLNMYIFGTDRKLYLIDLNVYQPYEEAEMDVSFGVYQVTPEKMNLLKGFNSDDKKLMLKGLNIDVDCIYHAIMNVALAEDLKIKKAVPSVIERGNETNKMDGFKFFNVTVKSNKYKA